MKFPAQAINNSSRSQEDPPSNLPPLVVAIVGRPNVGKSTLFNRILGYRSAIVADYPGTTRDRIVSNVIWASIPFVIVDTGGLESNPDSSLSNAIRGQVESAIQDADIVIFLTDVTEGVTPGDKDISQSLRKHNKNVILVVNKVDNASREFDVPEFHVFGLGNTIPISAYHNLGIEDIIASVLSFAPKESVPASPENHRIRLTLVGRPNVGKSQLTNCILGQERSIVSDTPGTTRDALDTPFEYRKEPLTLIDTAGIRRRGKVEKGIENFSVVRSLKAITRSEIVILLLDASELVTAQDTHVASYISESFKTMVIAVNKWDLAPQLGIKREQIEQVVQERFKFVRHAPILFVSALNGEGVDALLQTAITSHEKGKVWVPQAELRLAGKHFISRHTPQASKGTIKLSFGKVYQESTSPPTFVFEVNRPELVHFSYQRYLENSLRKEFDLSAIPIKLILRVKPRKGLRQ